MKAETLVMVRRASNWRDILPVGLQHLLGWMAISVRARRQAGWGGGWMGLRFCLATSPLWSPRIMDRAAGATTPLRLTETLAWKDTFRRLQNKWSQAEPVLMGWSFCDINGLTIDIGIRRQPSLQILLDFCLLLTSSGWPSGVCPKKIFYYCHFI